MKLTPKTRLQPRLRRGVIGTGATVLLLAALWLVLRPVPPAPEMAGRALQREALPVSLAAQAADQGSGAQLAGLEAEILTLTGDKHPDAAQQRRLAWLRRQAALLRQVQDLELRLALRGAEPGFDRSSCEARLRATRAQLTPATD